MHDPTRLIARDTGCMVFAGGVLAVLVVLAGLWAWALLGRP